MLMLDKFEILKSFAYRGNTGEVGKDGFTPQERHWKLFCYINEKFKQGHPVITSHEFKHIYGTDKHEFTNTVQILRRYGIVGMHNEPFNKDGIYYRGFVYLKCNEHLVEEYMLEKFGRFNKEGFIKSISQDVLYDKTTEEESISISNLRKRLEFLITEQQFKMYKKMRKANIGRTKIALMFGIKRWQLVAGVENAMKRKFNKLSEVN